MHQFVSLESFSKRSSVDLHVYVVEHEEEAETVQVRESPMAKGRYVVRDSAKHALSVAFMGSLVDPKFTRRGSTTCGK